MYLFIAHAIACQAGGSLPSSHTQTTYSRDWSGPNQWERGVCPDISWTCQGSPVQLWQCTAAVKGMTPTKKGRKREGTYCTKDNRYPDREQVAGSYSACM